MRCRNGFDSTVCVSQCTVGAPPTWYITVGNTFAITMALDIILPHIPVIAEVRYCCGGRAAAAAATHHHIFVACGVAFIWDSELLHVPRDRSGNIFLCSHTYRGGATAQALCCGPWRRKFRLERCLVQEQLDERFQGAKFELEDNVAGTVAAVTVTVAGP